MIKIHIDNLDNEDGRVWAVQDGRKYHRVHKILVDIDLETRTSKRQPRAFLTGHGKLEIVELRNETIALVTRK